MERQYSIREAAERLKVTYTRVHVLVKKGRIVADRTGRYPAIPESEILKYEQERREFFKCNHFKST